MNILGKIRYVYQISIICIFQIRFNHVKTNILTQIWELFSIIIKNRCRHCGNIGEFMRTVEALVVQVHHDRILSCLPNMQRNSEKNGQNNTKIHTQTMTAINNIFWNLSCTLGTFTHRCAPWNSDVVDQIYTYKAVTSSFDH